MKFMVMHKHDKQTEAGMKRRPSSSLRWESSSANPRNEGR